MEQSLFVNWVNRFFKPLVAKVVEKVNGTKVPVTYLFKEMLTKEYSPTLKWSSLSADYTNVAADVVAMDSSLPLKKRDAISKADGDIPKLGMKLQLNERTMTDLGILARTGGQESQLVQKLFADTPKCINGVYEVLELMFLQGLSTGVTLIEDDNVGAGIRIDYGYKSENKFGTSGAVWATSATATPLTDIELVLEKARQNGDVITTVMMDTFAFNNFKKTTEVKEAYAGFLGIPIGSGSILPTPTFSQINEFVSSEYGFRIRTVNRTVKTEKNGIRTNVTPWAEGAVVFLTSENVGTLTWGRLAEMDHPAKQVSYAVADDYILVSKYHKNDPLAEFTSSQALALPVINNVDSIYLLDSKTVQA